MTHIDQRITLRIVLVLIFATFSNHMYTSIIGEIIYIKLIEPKIGANCKSGKLPPLYKDNIGSL